MAVKKIKNKKTDTPCGVSRNGIPVFARDQDLARLFIESAHADGESAENSAHAEGTVPEAGDVSRSRLQRDRHGVPFLDKGRSLADLFNVSESGETQKSGDRETFPELLESSLKGKNQDALLREKRDRLPPRPVPLKKRLKRYPPPQHQLDLHGFTAAEAYTHADAFLRRFWRNGFFTVRIVVGKGLHSPFGAVLPDVVEDLLLRLKQDGVVLWFEWDQKEKARSGAVIVYLKQFD